ncbi:hypothetical protein CJ030_MR1G018618 [Morella rubra]|uniref:Transposase Tnp1/En/Spm-like domain-containing protein n=1 Tax=Morella rubra TaxID=262757 RepID=A0A6A1V707_9ROSI|nr:hypothetical protein CJ030_MR7G022899 [Morella rubra]KAB1225489.1 hypothetical protein CJ030_MR1G018618 [Morella rubra]
MAPFGKKKKGNAAEFWLGPSKNANINMYGNQSTVNPSLNTNVRVFAGKGGLPPNDPVPGKNKRKYMLIDEEVLEIPTFNLMSSSQNTVQTDDESPKRRGQGPAKGIEFDKMRKFGRIPLVVIDNAKGVSCDNTRLFTERMTLCLIGTVMKIRKRLSRNCKRRSGSIYRYKLHHFYNSFNDSKVARENPPDDVDIEAWYKLCDRWEDEDYKTLCKKNADNRTKLRVNHTAGSKSLHRLRVEKRSENITAIDFYKRSRVRKDGSWICPEAEQLYLKMVELQKERDPEKKDEGIANDILTEVLGCKSGYVRGMGKSVIPPPSTQSRSSTVMRLDNQVEKYKSEAERYKSAYETVTTEVKQLLEQCKEYASKWEGHDRKIEFLYEQIPGRKEENKRNQESGRNNDNGQP